MPKEILKDEKYKLIDAEENPELARKYGIMQAPTLVIVDDDGVQKYAGAGEYQKICGCRKGSAVRE